MPRAKVRTLRKTDHSKKPRFKISTFERQTYRGNGPVKEEVSGPVLKGLGMFSEGRGCWTVIHIASGLALRTLNNKGAARRLILNLQETFQIDWEADEATVFDASMEHNLPEWLREWK